MANILASIIPDPDTGLYSSRVAGINGNEIYISDGADGEARSWAFQTALFYLADTSKPISNSDYFQSNFENKLSYWRNIFLIPNNTFNPGINRQGWVFHPDTYWTYLAPQVFEQQQYAPFWLWFENLKYLIDSVENTMKWCYFDRSYMGEHWCFQKQYINPDPTNSPEFKIYDTALDIKIVEPGKPEGFGVYMYVNDLGGNRAFIVNSKKHIFMSEEDISGVPRQLDYVKLEADF